MLPFKLYIISIVCLLITARRALAQQHAIDSMRQELAMIGNDSLKCEMLYRIGILQEAIDYKLSRKIFDTVAFLAQKHNYPLLEARAYLENGGLGFDHGDYASAIRYYNKAQTQFKLVKGQEKIYGLAAVYNNLGGILSLINDWESAQKYYYRALKEFEKLDDSTKMETVYFNLSFVYSDMDEWQNSLDHLYRSVAMIGGSSNRSQNLTSCSRLATVCFKTHRIKEGLHYLKKSDSLLQYSNGNVENIYYNHAYGEYHYVRRNFKTAIMHHMMAYNYALKWDDPYYIADESTEIGKDYLQLKQFDSADRYFQIAYGVATRYNFKPKVLLSLKYLSKLEEAKGNFKKAYYYKNKQAEFADSLVKEQNHYRILLMDEEFESEKRSNQIAQLQKDRQIQMLSIKQKSNLNYYLTASLGILLITAFVSYRNLRNRQRLAKQQDELQRQRIRELEKDKQLVAVDSLLKGQEEERSRLASDLHDGLGGLLSGVKFSLSNMKDNLIITPDNMTVFERSLDMLDTSIRELRRVAHNMMPEMLTKFGLDEALREYCNTINTAKLVNVKYQSLGMETRLDKSAEILIYRIVQELLNNILKHSRASEAFVQLIREGNRLNVVVEDNGEGFDPGIVENNKGAGLINVQRRVEYLKGQLDIHAEPGKGTLVNIEFNIPL